LDKPEKILEGDAFALPGMVGLSAGALLLFAAMKAAPRSFTLMGETGFPIHREIRLWQ